MSEVAQEAQHEFWRPPSPLTAAEIVHPAIEALPSMAEVCSRCGREFLMGSRFCHSCGGRRPEAISADAAVIAGLWQQVVERTQAACSALARLKFPAWLRYLQFHEIKTRVGLSTASLIAFMIGLGCVAGALLVGATDPSPPRPSITTHQRRSSPM